MKRSCESQLIFAVNEVAKSVNNGEQIEAIQVSCIKLLQKLDLYAKLGVSPKNLTSIVQEG